MLCFSVWFTDREGDLVRSKAWSEENPQAEVLANEEAARLGRVFPELGPHVIAEPKFW
jgi:hypothetical protein